MTIKKSFLAAAFLLTASAAQAANGGLDYSTTPNRYVDVLLPKPKLPRKARKKAKFFTLADVAKIVAASQGEQRAFSWLFAETGMRSGEFAGLRLADIDGERLTAVQSIWGVE